MQCAEIVGIQYDTMLACIIGGKGKELQLKAENQTHQLARPYPNYVPAITFNHVIRIYEHKMTFGPRI